MKIFNRGNDPKGAAPAAAATTAAAPATQAAPATPAAPGAPAGASAPAPAVTSAPAPAVPAAPDLSVILDANVKEMSEKIARLASTLENAQEERTGFEAKIEQMEDRMRKLSSLTEMISAQYNPFVGDAPSERGEMPHPEVGLAPPPLAEPPPPAVSAAVAPPPEISLDLDPVSLPDFGALPPLDTLPTVAADLAAPLQAEPSLAAPPAAVTAPDPRPRVIQTPEPNTIETEPGVYLWSSPPGFESSALLLRWADMLLKSAGSRQSLLELVNYYHNIGWIGDPARDQLLAYADGLSMTQPTTEAPDWRTNVEVHEKSLFFVEKLRTVSSRRHL